MKITFIATVLNEQNSIGDLLKSLNYQSTFPDEIIIVDGGSKDRTIAEIKNSAFAKASADKQNSNRKIRFRLLIKKGNRSVGRNEAIRQASGDIIVCSDAGNILDQNWVKNIVKPFNDAAVDVVAGYYKGKPDDVFQKCLVPYVLVMEDRINSEDFLPATRSIAFRKRIWDKVGGFDEKYSNNEDYIFAKKLGAKKANIKFTKDAIVYWKPRKNLKESFIMFYRFALGDGESGIFREKVFFIFLRYFITSYLLIISLVIKSSLVYFFIVLSFLVYISWSIWKNYKYVNKPSALIYLPLLQFCSDIAVVLGTSIGYLKRLKVKKDYYLIFMLLIYTIIILSTLRWGIPNQNHPFPYHMDEWHQFHAVVTTFREGTPNTEGSANGTIFHFVLSGIYLIPFVLFQVIDPTQLKIDDFFMRERLFTLLRINTLIFGILSVLVLYKIQCLIGVAKKLAVTLFVFTPIWLMLGGYFKYDIALIFWMLLSLYFLLRFAKNPSNLNFFIASLPCALAISVKISAAPLLIGYIFSYFWFFPQWKRNIKYLFLSILFFISFVFLFGMVDTLLGKGNIGLYLFDNIIQTPGVSVNYLLGMPSLLYIFTNHYLVIFGHGLMLLFLLSIIFWIYFIFKNRFKKSLKPQKIPVFLFIMFLLFLLSVTPLKIFAGGNRSLVLLPFLIILVSFSLEKMLSSPRIRKWIIVVIAFSLVIQIYESMAWVYMKKVKSPQEVSSLWIEKNIPKQSLIGIENIPIYQNLPDIIQKEFYYSEYGINHKNNFKYQIIEGKTEPLPNVIVITNGEIERKLIKKSAKKELMTHMEQEGYKRVKFFTPDFKYMKISDIDYYFSWILASPLTISVYQK